MGGSIWRGLGLGLLASLAALALGCDPGLCTNTCASARNGSCEDGLSSGRGACAVGTDCSDCGPRYVNGSANFPPIPTGPPSEAEQYLNDLLRSQFPDGSPAGGGEVDESIGVAAMGMGSVRAPVDPGTSMNIGVGYTSTSAPINAVCIGFGSRSSAWCIPRTSGSVSASGDSMSGALSVPFTFDAALCSMLSRICHDIRCYEFARTSSGTVTRDNISMLAMACGNCDEPSCQQLLEMCMVPDEPDPPGPIGSCSDFTSCGGSCSYRSCASTSGGSSVRSWYETNDGRRFDCAGTDCMSAARQVVSACCT